MKVARKPKKKPWGLQTLGSLRVKIKLTVTVRPGSKVKYSEGCLLYTLGSLRVKLKLTLTVRPGSKVKYNEGKYKLTNHIDWVDKI